MTLVGLDINCSTSCKKPDSSLITAFRDLLLNHIIVVMLRSREIKLIILFIGCITEAFGALSDTLVKEVWFRVVEDGTHCRYQILNL